MRRFNLKPFHTAMLVTVAALWFIFIFSAPLPMAGESTASSHALEKAAESADGGAPLARWSPKWSHETSDLKPAPDLIFGRLPNGFRYILMENNTPKDRVSMHLNIEAGSFHETDDQRGLAHFLEHMVFNGSENFEPGELVKYFQNIGMDFGPDANGRTGFFSTVYDIVLPKGDIKSIKDGFVVLKDYAEGALLLPEEIDKERGVILAEMRQRDSASFRTYKETLKFELPESRIPERLPIGVRETVEAADRERLKDYYDTWYRPERMILVMVGAFDVDAVKPLIETFFGSMTARAPERPEPEPGIAGHESVKPFYHHEPEAGNTDVTIQVIERAASEPDSVKARKNSMLKSIGSRIVQNRLNRMLRKPDTPFTDASIGAGTALKYVDYGYISADGGPERWEDTLKSLEQVLRQALEHGFTEAELERVRKEYRAALEQAVRNAPTRDSSHLARQIMYAVNDDKVFLSPEQELEMFGPFIEKLTPEEVHDTFKAVWKPDHRLVMVTGNAKIEADEPVARIRSIYDRSVAVAVAKPATEEVPAFPYLPEPKESGAVASKTVIDDLGIIQVDFENGLRLNMKKTDFKADEIMATLTFGRGRSDEPTEKPGLGLLAESVINESGLGALNAEQLEAALAGSKTTVGFQVEDEAFSLRGQTVPEETALMFQWMYTYLNDPGYREEAYRLAMERFRQEYERMRQTIEGAMPLTGNRFLAGGDSRFGYPPMDRFETLTLADVREWTSGPLKNAPLELSVVGDFEPDAVIALAGRYFGSLERRKALATLDRPERPDFPEGESREIVVETRIDKGEVRVAFPTDDIWDIHQTRRLSTLASVLSERLREVIREKLGATYSPYAYNAPSDTYPDYGVFQAVISVDPKRAATVVAEIRGIVTDMRKNGVTEDELRRSIDPTLTSIKDMRQENRYWLNTVLNHSRRHPEKIEWARTIEADYAAITAAEVNRVAKAFLDNDKAAVIVVRPTTDVAESVEPAAEPPTG